MTFELREKVQTAIQALIDVESSLKQEGVISGDHAEKIHETLAAARHTLVDLNAPEYDN
jgi:intergrase/recombinase